MRAADSQHRGRHRRTPAAAAAAAAAAVGPGGGGGGAGGCGGRLYLAVAAVACSCYVNALHGDFVHDDIPAVTRNRDVVGGGPLADLFRDDFWGTPMSDAGSHKSYRPLTTLTFRVTYAAAGLAPRWFHAANVLLHAAASLLFTRVCRAVAGLSPRFAAVAGLLFAAHPVHTEAVTGIVGRADVLACVFFLLSFLAYHGGEPQDGHVWLSVLLGALSMLAKETGVTVLLVNLLFDLYRSWHAIKRSVLEVRWNEETLQFARRSAKILMSLSLLLVFRLALLHGSLPRFSNQDNPAAFHPSRLVRFLTFCYLAAFNCWLLLCPATLSHDWQMGSVPLVASLGDARNLATALFFLCCLLVLCRCALDLEAQRHPAAVLGALLLALPFLPAANLLVTVGFVVAERVLYLPSLGSALLAAYGAQLLWGALLRQRPLLLAAGLLLLLLLCSRTLARNRDWAGREALVRAGLKALPHNAKMHYNLANFLRDSGELERAAEHYKEALRLWPAYASAHNNLGTLMAATEEAERHFLAAIRHSPNHVNAHYNLGQVYRRENRTLDAVHMLERCVRLDAGYTPAYLLLSKLYAALGLHREVGRLLGLVARLQPRSADHLAELADWLLAQGRSWEALAQYQQALAESASHRAALLGAARILRAKGQRARVHQLMLRSLAASPARRGSLVYTGDLYNIKSWRLPDSGSRPPAEAPSLEPAPAAAGCSSRAGLCDEGGAGSAAMAAAAAAAAEGAAERAPDVGRRKEQKQKRREQAAAAAAAAAWRRRPPVNRSEAPRSAEARCSARPRGRPPLRLDPALAQSYHDACWSEQGEPNQADDDEEEAEGRDLPEGAAGEERGAGEVQQPAATLHLEVSSVPLAISDQDMLCLAAPFPDPAGGAGAAGSVKTVSGATASGAAASGAASAAGPAADDPDFSPEFVTG